MRGRIVAAGAALLGALLLVSTCRQSRPEAGSALPHAMETGAGLVGPASTLAGAWSTGCLADPAEAGAYSQDTRTFAADLYTAVFITYSDPKCQSPQVTQAQSGRYQAAPRDSAIPATLDFERTELLVTLQTPEMVRAYNDRGICGGGWVIGIQRPLSLDACEAGPQDDGRRFERVAIRGATLYFGVKDGSHGGLTAQTRPAAIDESRPFARL